MNKTKLAKCLQHRVRLRPPARRFRGVTELRIMDDDWLVQDVEDKKGVRIRNIRTDHVALLGLDQIRDYIADPRREYDGLRHGFLELKVQLFLRGPELVIEPRPSSVTRAATKRPRATARKRTARKPQPTNPAKKISRKQA